MRTARLALDPAFTVGPVPRRLFGSFVEHMGRCVYTGIFEPDHPSADEDGLRTDVLELTKELGPTVVRYPGGNFVSGFDWEDSVGPRDERPRRIDRAWRSVETNQFGLAEFDSWARKVGTEPMMAVNLGTRGLQEACDLLEYSNHTSGTKFSDLRIQHGSKDPFGIKLWCLGNELDGPWQTGHKTAAEYGRLAAETGMAMRTIDPDIELVAVGSSSRAMPTFGEWEQTVLELSYHAVDYVSLHAYYQEHDGDAASFLASAVDMDLFIDQVVATADAVRAKGKHSKRINLSFDEWNVWYQSKPHHGPGVEPWDVAPRVIEDEYSITDAVVVGTLLNSLLRHADRVHIGAQAQLVNVIGLLRSEPGGEAWKQTIAHPFEQVRRLATGNVLQVVTSSEKYETAKFDAVDVVDASATYDDEFLTVFLANRDQEQPASVEVPLRAFDVDRVATAKVLAAAPGQDRHTTNLEGDHAAVGLRALEDVTVTEGLATVVLPPLSWAVVQFRKG
ncbi:alpha-N-arabinofuranosidase [Kineococcus sp. NPDC059986]|uniref:arabinosylfuranosidase ArfA n=1 Tax=Kineococcus sp. NPDC059986 TaxID=3155538 RepID=UPI00344BAE8E